MAHYASLPEVNPRMPAPDPPTVLVVDTKDLTKSVEFYRASLGMQVHHDNAPEFVMVKISRETALCLEPAAPGAAPSNARILITVKNVPEKEKELKAKGLVIVSRSPASGPPTVPPTTRVWFAVKDPDGREVVFQNGVRT